MSELLLIGKNAKEASYDLGVLSTKEKDNALLLMAEELVRSKSEILDANKVDLENAKEKADGTEGEQSGKVFRYI